MSNTKELEYWVGFTRAPGIGRVRLGVLKSYFGELSTAWNATKFQLIRAGLDEKTVEGIVSFRKAYSLVEEMDRLQKYQVNAVTYESPEYPALLKETPDSPALIYVRGALKDISSTCIAVVGTRRSTAYGRQVTEELVSKLVSSGVTIVSGLAKGIDAIAHRTAIDVRGRTVAVFASGLDIVYPPENLRLAREIMENGALVSEYPLGTKPKAEHFPRRNRILSGISRGVLVVESGESGGALITANFALEQNREVFAVPGNVFSAMSKGPNRLIQEGAKLVRNHLDIIEELNISDVAQQLEMTALEAPLGEMEAAILNCTGEEPTHIDEICRNTGISTSSVLSKLAVMELNGLVRHLGGMSYVLARRIK
jgi:DNA processing protein